VERTGIRGVEAMHETMVYISSLAADAAKSGFTIREPEIGSSLRLATNFSGIILTEKLTNFA
jgi:hypothetical protein